MRIWARHLGRLVLWGLVLASLAPGCDGGGKDGDPNALLAPDQLAGNSMASGCHADPDPSPELLPNAQLDADVIARAAAVFGSCWPDDGVPRVASQLWSANIGARRNYYLNVVQARCLADARCGCAAVEHCLGYQVLTGLAAGCQSSCEGERFTACGAGVDLPEGSGFGIDCARVGQRCQLSGICVDGVGSSCDGSEPPVCRPGARPLYCDDDALREGPDCAALGLGCADGHCEGTGAACTNEQRAREEIVAFEGISCQAGTLEACVAGKRASLACAEQGPGFDCQLVEGVPFCGLASECLPAEVGGSYNYPTPSCDGTRLSFCNAGRLETLDCASLGFSGCQIGAGNYGCTPSLSFPD
jgi:hypothetical protein